MNGPNVVVTPEQSQSDVFIQVTVQGAMAINGPNVEVTPSLAQSSGSKVLERLSRLEKLALLEVLEEQKRRVTERMFYHQFPDTGNLRRELYVKHMEFFKTGAKHSIRVFMAANRVGKSYGMAYEMVCHLIGVYPDWWEGKRFTAPVDTWIVGDISKTVRDILQNVLLGDMDHIGTGMIPALNIERCWKAMGVAEYLDTVTVKHSSGGISSIQFKSYDQGRKAFQGTAKDIIWLDEECNEEIYQECLMRTMTTNGMIVMTFTPLLGMTKLIQNLEAAAKTGTNTSLTIATWDDVPHLSSAQKDMMYAALPPHQRDARAKGIPQLGSGAIYPVQESVFLVAPFEIPAHYKRAYALDVGWNRTAAIWGAVDPESGIMYLYSEHYVGSEQPIIHAEAIKGRGTWIPGVIDPASRGRGQDDGQRLLDQYKNHGLILTTANNAVEAGIYAVWEQLSTGKIKVFNNLGNFMDEFRLYQRDTKGHIHKSNDHLMDATRYLCMSGKDKAIQKPVATYTDSYYGQASPNVHRGNFA
jgi:phage terminase large subunit-like protein